MNNDIAEAMLALKGPPKKILVVGDVMLDETWNCTGNRRSPEYDVPIIAPESITYAAGGAANVALSCAALGQYCTLLGCSGWGDEARSNLLNVLKSNRVRTKLIEYSSIQTTRKVRIVHNGVHVLRMDYETPIGSSTYCASVYLLDALREEVRHHDLVIFSDYNKGALTFMREMIHFCRAAGTPIVVDPKQENWDLYSGADLICPNYAEALAAFRRAHINSQVQSKNEIAMFLSTDYGISAVALTCASDGCLLYSMSPGMFCEFAATTPADSVVDVTGAGDTITATMGCLMAHGVKIEVAMRIANEAAGIAVRNAGTYVVTADELASVLRGGADTTEFSASRRGASNTLGDSIQPPIKLRKL